MVDISEDLALYLADSTLAAGLQYGLWVERAPSTEEQVALSSMSQDKLGHARAFYEIAEEVTGRSTVELQYDRSTEAFLWNPAWLVPLKSWDHLVLAQALFAPALMLDVRAHAEGSAPVQALAKMEQEEHWHTRHANAWLEREAADGVSDPLSEAFGELWPFAVAFFGAAGGERFPADRDAKLRTRPDDALRVSYLEEMVPLLGEVGLEVPAEKTESGWRTDPEPTGSLVDSLRDEVADQAVELAGLLQDPEGRALAELV